MLVVFKSAVTEICGQTGRKLSHNSVLKSTEEISTESRTFSSTSRMNETQNYTTAITILLYDL